MYRDGRFDLASDHSSMMKVAYSGAEVESKGNVCYRQNCEQDSNRKTNQESGRNYETMVETWRIWPLKRTSRALCSEKRISNWTCRSSIPVLGPFLVSWTQLEDSISLSSTVPRNSSGNQRRKFFR